MSDTSYHAVRSYADDDVEGQKLTAADSDRRTPQWEAGSTGRTKHESRSYASFVQRMQSWGNGLVYILTILSFLNLLTLPLWAMLLQQRSRDPFLQTYSAFTMEIDGVISRLRICRSSTRRNRV